jgi:hypothetical protein
LVKYKISLTLQESWNDLKFETEYLASVVACRTYAAVSLVYILPSSSDIRSIALLDPRCLWCFHRIWICDQLIMLGMWVVTGLVHRIEQSRLLLLPVLIQCLPCAQFCVPKSLGNYLTLLYKTFWSSHPKQSIIMLTADWSNSYQQLWTWG